MSFCFLHLWIRSEIESIELELEGHTNLTLKEIQQIRSEIKQLNEEEFGGFLPSPAKRLQRESQTAL